VLRVRRAPEALRQTQALLSEADTPLQQAGALAKRVPPVVPPVLRLAHAAEPELPRLTRTLVAGLPPLRTLAPRRCDVLGWASNWASMLSWGVDGGGAIGPLNVFRLELIGNNHSLGGAVRTLGPEHGNNPYPAPCEAGTEKRP
jgi:hypothetical protein